jgi:ditrans,polycis-polyprenyl diphosphate synthase
MHLFNFQDRLKISPPGWASSHLETLLIRGLRQEGAVPEHVAFIMDGNRRYARKHNMPIARGHMLGLEAMEKVWK